MYFYSTALKPAVQVINILLIFEGHSAKFKLLSYCKIPNEKKAEEKIFKVTLNYKEKDSKSGCKLFVYYSQESNLQGS